MRRLLVTVLLATTALLASSGCQTFRSHVGPLHGIDLEVGYRGALGDNGITGTSIDGQGQGRGHSRSAFSGNSFANHTVTTNVVFRFRPSE
jgi:hypothetical protein